jgi:hypothetical protein
MKCSRCGGPMTGEMLFDESQEHVWALRCIHCGDIIDPVIMANRNRNAVRVALENLKPLMEGGNDAASDHV